MKAPDQRRCRIPRRYSELAARHRLEAPFSAPRTCRRSAGTRSGSTRAQRAKACPRRSKARSTTVSTSRTTSALRSTVSGYDFSIVAHPVVEDAPRDETKILWVNFTQQPHIIGLDIAESQEAPAASFSRNTRSQEYPGSLLLAASFGGVLGQPRGGALRAVRNYGDFPRVLERILIADGVSCRPLTEGPSAGGPACALTTTLPTRACGSHAGEGVGGARPSRRGWRTPASFGGHRRYPWAEKYRASSVLRRRRLPATRCASMRLRCGERTGLGSGRCGGRRPATRRAEFSSPTR